MNLSDNEKIIIVLGASGDTGKYFVNYFLEECKNDSYKTIFFNKNPRLYYIICDIMSIVKEMK